MSAEPKRLTVEEAAKVLACSPHTVRRMIASGVLRACRRVGGRGWILTQEDVERCLEEFVPDAPVRTRTQASREYEEALRKLKDAGIG